MGRTTEDWSPSIVKNWHWGGLNGREEAFIIVSCTVQADRAMNGEFDTIYNKVETPPAAILHPAAGPRTSWHSRVVPATEAAEANPATLIQGVKTPSSTSLSPESKLITKIAQDKSYSRGGL